MPVQQEPPVTERSFLHILQARVEFLLHSEAKNDTSLTLPTWRHLLAAMGLMFSLMSPSLSSASRMRFLLLLAAHAVSVVSVTKHWLVVDSVLVETKKNLPFLFSFCLVSQSDNIVLINSLMTSVSNLSPFNVLLVSPHGQREREKKAGQQTKTFHPRFVLREQ